MKRITRPALPATLTVIAVAFCADAARGGEHPTLLISRTDLARIRHVCGVGPRGPIELFGPFAAASREFQALREELSRSGAFGRDEARNEAAAILPGELAGAALMHLIDPSDAGDASRIAAIQDALRRPPLLDDDGLEAVLALDWCWPVLQRDVRREFVLAVRERAALLTPTDSLLDHRAFRERLLTLAVVIAVDSRDEPGGAWGEFRQRVLDAARTYFESTFSTFVGWRGLSPTSTAAAMWELSDAALAVELWRHLDPAAWEQQRGGVGRWCEYDLLTVDAARGMGFGFLHDDRGSASAMRPLRADGPIPLSAFLIAARTRDPAAAAWADRIEQAAGRAARPLALCISSILFDTRDVPRADAGRLPHARNLGGSFVLRGGDRPNETVVWIDAGQPFLARNQHFDAGHFLISGPGELAVAAGDDISREAIVEKGGRQRLGTRDQAFDFDQFFSSTLAHNALIVDDPARAAQWRGQRYHAIAGQLPRDGVMRDFITPPGDQGRAMGRTLAYGASGETTYIALDLTAAYDGRSLARYTREFVFTLGRVLIVIDRARPAHNRAAPISIVQLAAQPIVDGAPLSAARRISGRSEDAGIWQLGEGAAWLHVRRPHASLWIAPAWPQSRIVRVAGGPAMPIPHRRPGGDAISYIGGTAESFERLMQPLRQRNPANAWYRLGPKSEADFAQMPHWGRVEIEAASEQARYVFVTVLVSDSATATSAPRMSVVRGPSGFEIELAIDGRRATLQIGNGEKLGGRVEFDSAPAMEFPSEIANDPPLVVMPKR